jgi:hypothetical protein
MASDDTSGIKDKPDSAASGLSVTALFAAAGAVAAGVAALRAVGVVGQMERNHPVWFFVAIGLAVVGTLLSALVVSGLLGKDSDLTSLRAAAGQAAADAQDIQTKTDAAYAKAKAAKTDEDVLAAATETLDIADGIADKMRKVASAGAEFQRRLRKGSAERDALQASLTRVYELSGSVSDEKTRTAASADRANALKAAGAVAGRIHIRTRRANNLAARIVETDARDPSVVTRRVMRVVGAFAVGVAVVLACWLAVRVAGETEAPMIDVTTSEVAQPGDAKVATRTYDIDARVRLNDLPADAAVTVLVDWLRTAPAPGDAAGADANGPSGPSYSPTTLFHGKYGPDNDGTVDVHARVRLSRNTAGGTGYDAVGIQAYVADIDQPIDDNPCASYVKQVSGASNTQRRNRAGYEPGCVVVTLPSSIARDAQ